MDTNIYYKIEGLIGYTFKNKNLLKTAFTHSSLANEKKTDSNERMEFLGDSLLNFIIADTLYHSINVSEGEMSVLRAAMVSKEPLNKIIKKMGLDKYLEVSKSSDVSNSMRENLFEAILGAIYLDTYNIDNARNFVNLHLKAVIKQAIDKKGTQAVINYKSLLQERMQDKKTIIKYVDVAQSGSAHEPVFEVAVHINNNPIAVGKGRTKKEAGLNAALEACKKYSFI